MTIEELILKVGELSESVVMWFSSGFQTLLNGDWLQLTIGQTVFTTFFSIYLASMVIGLTKKWNTRFSSQFTFNVLGFAIVIITIVVMFVNRG